MLALRAKMLKPLPSMFAVMRTLREEVTSKTEHITAKLHKGDFSTDKDVQNLSNNEVPFYSAGLATVSGLVMLSA